MSALEREIVEKFQQLQPTAKQRVRMIIDEQADQATIDDARDEVRAAYRE